MFDVAIDSLNKALAIKSDDADLYYYLGISYGYKGRIDTQFNLKSEEAYKKGLTIQPKSSMLLYALSVLYYFNFNNKPEAIELMKQAKINSPNSDYKIPAMLARYYYEADDFKKAIEYYQESIKLTSSDYIHSQLNYNLGKIYLKIDDKKNAADYFRKSLKNNPKAGEIRKLLQT